MVAFLHRHAFDAADWEYVKLQKLGFNPPPRRVSPEMLPNNDRVPFHEAARQYEELCNAVVDSVADPLPLAPRAPRGTRPST